jgi:predicted transposase YdaD
VANIDIPIKRLIQLTLNDWVKLIVPSTKSIEITEMDKEKVPKIKSSMDKLIWIDDGTDKKIINIEPQGYKDTSFSARMLRYRADIWEYTLRKGLGNPSIIQAAIYFFKQDIQKPMELKDTDNHNSKIQYQYDIIKIWKLKKSTIIKNKLIGLYPLLPLMEKGPEETPEEIIELTINTINTVEDEPLKSDLISVMSVISSREFSKEMLKKYVRREMLMKSALYQEWIAEEREEAAIKRLKQDISEILIEKFDYITKEIKEKLNTINDEEILDSLFRKAVRIDSIESFETLIEKVQKGY